MTRYTVVWNSDFEAQYTDAWTKSDSETREILTELANWVDRELVDDPVSKGRLSAEPLTYIAAVPNALARISVAYQVLPDDRLVRVVRMTFKRDN